MLDTYCTPENLPTGAIQPFAVTDTKPLIESEDKAVPAGSRQSSDTPICSTLAAGNPRFEATVEQFLPRLDEQLVAIQKALDAHDWNELKNPGHWLKGSVGTVGFDCLSTPAVRLENAADAKTDQAAREALSDILALRKKLRASAVKTSTATASTALADQNKKAQHIKP